jgi:hypothetical protein
MKMPIVIKQSVFASLLLVGLNFYTSCDSCSRNKDKKNTDATTDTIVIDSSAYNEDSGSTNETGGASGNIDGSSSTSVDAASGKTGTAGTKNAATTVPKRKLTEEEITNQVENSNASNAVDKNGNPIRSGGSAGTGSGTGTGSTGNNSKVTNAKDQKS